MNGYIPYITLKGEALCTFEKLMQSKITDKIKELHVAKINKWFLLHSGTLKFYENVC